MAMDEEEYIQLRQNMLSGEVASMSNEQKIEWGQQAMLAALPYYDLIYQEIVFNQLSDACTFTIAAAQQQYLIRVHFNVSTLNVEQEIQWLAYLQQETELTLPQGIPDRKGRKVQVIVLDGGPTVTVSLMQWVDGAPIDKGLTEQQAFQEGVILAKLHLASKKMVKETSYRKWDEHSLRLAMDRLNEYYHHFLLDEEFALYKQAALRASAFVQSLEQTPNQFGLIHADAHQGNWILYDDEPRLIDFGRCGLGFYLYDLAHPLLGLSFEHRNQLIRGYKSLIALESGWVEALEHFVVMVLVENYAHHCSDPREFEGLKAEQRHALPLIQAYLHGKRFLLS